MFKFTKSNVLFYIVHPAMLAFYCIIIVIIFIPDYFKKYSAKVIESRHISESEQVFYYDLDSDGITEKIITGYNNLDKNISVRHLNQNNNVYGQWMPKGNWLKNYKPTFGDYNGNGFSEIYCITIKGDSLFLNAKELMNENGLLIEGRFLCNPGVFKNGETDITDWGGKMIDLNGDGNEEFVFILHGGYSKYPRNIFAYYITSDSLAKSPPSASGIDFNTQYMDINGDGVEEITGHIGSPENIHYEMPYTDSASWLMVFDPTKMNFLFPPIRFDLGIGSYAHPVFYKLYDKNYIAVSLFGNSARRSMSSHQLKLFDEKGKLLKERNINKNEIRNLKFINPHFILDNNFYVIDDCGNTYKADTSLLLSPIFRSNFENIGVKLNNHIKLDIDGNGQNEILFLGGNNEAENYLIIFRQNLNEPILLPIPENGGLVNPHFNIMNDKKDKSPLLMLQGNNYTHKIKYRKNAYYFLKYPSYFLLYILLFFLFWLILKIQSKYLSQKYETERLLMRQQMALSKRQLEPHFMLNTLNNIGYMFTKENQEDAQYYFGRFSSLIHRGLLYADQVETSLQEELEFVRDFLILQKQRFNGDLAFTVESDFEIDLSNIRIPHSLVFTFVENAVKHGLMHKNSDRKLSIQISNTSNHTEIVITDNGIGRKQSKVLKTKGTGKGMGIVANIIKGYNKLNNRSISYEVKDLDNDNGGSVGTEVRVVI